MVANKTFLDNDVAMCVLPKNYSQNDILNYESLKDVLVPYEVKITKAKDGTKDKKTYMLFCTENLRIYNNIDEYIADIRQLRQNTKDLEGELNDLLLNTSTGDLDLCFLNMLE